MGAHLIAPKRGTLFHRNACELGLHACQHLYMPCLDNIPIYTTAPPFCTGFFIFFLLIFKFLALLGVSSKFLGPIEGIGVGDSLLWRRVACDRTPSPSLPTNQFNISLLRIVVSYFHFLLLSPSGVHYHIQTNIV